MNYRHGYHAGNHTEVFKHAALIAVIDLIAAKDKPFLVIDTHAGAGVHDLGSEMALRTREAEPGIRRVAADDAPELRRYLDVVRAVGGDAVTRYPGSPEIIRRGLGPRDRLVACELHPEDAAALRATMRGDPRVAVHHRDGYEAMLALIPPPERRGLVFLDPPFEKPGEAEAMAEGLARAARKWETGIFVAWYPIKDRAIERTLQAMVPACRAKDATMAWFLSQPFDGVHLAGSGLLILNPPWGLDARLSLLCEALACSYDQATWSVERIKADHEAVVAPTPRPATRPR